MEHERYNRRNYPRCVWSTPDRNWSVYADAQGRCASIPNDDHSGALASHFGDLAHVARIKREEAERAGFNIYGRARA